MCVLCVRYLHRHHRGLGCFGEGQCHKKRALKAPLRSEGPLANGVFIFPGLL